MDSSGSSIGLQPAFGHASFRCPAAADTAQTWATLESYHQRLSTVSLHHFPWLGAGPPIFIRQAANAIVLSLLRLLFQMTGTVKAPEARSAGVQTDTPR